MHKIFNQLEEYKVAIIGDVHLRLDNPRCRIDNYFQSLLLKLEEIIISNDIIICLGDLFDKPSVGEECIHSFLELLSKHNKPFYSIWGNHDLFKYNIEKLSRTSLGICILESKVKHLSLIQVHNIKFKEIPFVKHHPLLPNHDEKTILLGHFFYESEIDPNYSLTKQQLIESKSPIIFLGHEHCPFDPIKIEGTMLIRNGSICRNTVNPYNKRIPVYTQLIVSEASLKLKQTELKSAKLHEEIFTNDIDLTKKLLKNVQYIKTSFELLGDNELQSTQSIEEVIKNLKATDNHLDYYKNIKEKLDTKV